MNNIKWDSNLYDHKHAFVSTYGEELISFLNPEKGQRILDLGCGTGHNVAKISESGAHVVGIDYSEDMIKAAKDNYPHLHFEVKDAIDFAYDESFDAIFSNATLHWILEKEKAIASMSKNLKSGGKLVAEFGGRGNVAIMLQGLQHTLHQLGLGNEQNLKMPWYFPSLGEYSMFLEQGGFAVKYALHFDRPTELVSEDGIKDWFRMFGGMFLEDYTESETDEILTLTQAFLREKLYVNGKWYADYKRLRLVAIKL